MTPAGTPVSVLAPRWLAAAPENPLTDLSLDLWRWDVGDPRLGGTGLAAADAVRATSLTDARVPRYAATRHALRRVLGRYLSCEPNAIVFGHSAHGRPFIEHPPTRLDFNLSDSRDTVVLAVTQRGRVGVDIEYHRPMSDPMSIARRVLPGPWVAELARTPEAEQLTVFFSLWTRFEACQKARGHGVFAQRTAAPRECFGAFPAAPDCSAHVCIAGVDAVPEQQSWRFFGYPPDD